MRMCPVCSAASLSTAKVFMTSVSSPARCDTCGSFIATNNGILRLLLDVVLSYAVFLSGVIASLWLWSWWPAIVAFVLVVVVMPWAIASRRPLVAIPASDVAREQRFRLYALASLVVLFLTMIASIGLARGA